MAYLTRVLGDLGLAEDAVSDAYAAALDRWPRDGVPRNPAGWIVAAARNAAVDRIRRERALQARLPLLAADLETTIPPHEPTDDEIPDERLRLIFTCCHPALAPEAQVALTLRMVGGLTVPEVSRALVVPDATVAQRLVRAKRKLRDAGIPFRVPPPELMPDRLPVVLATVYLIYNEGHSATAGAALRRDDLAAEGIRLARVLAALMPDEPETLGLLAMMLLHDARRAARTDERGELVLLEDQDRDRWDREQIGEGLELTLRALRLAPAPRPYALQAAIAAEHARAPTWAGTDWRRISGLYAQLQQVAPSPVVELNHAVAVSFADGPGQGLPLVERLAAEGSLDRYYPLHAARADLLRRLGRPAEAHGAYARAASLATNDAERRFLERRLAETATSAAG